MSVYEELTESQLFAIRVIADHALSSAFAIADGILPGNEVRNYVLRKIMRRAIYHGREHLGLNDLFFYKVCDFVVGEMSGAFPELETQRDFIGKMVRIEEERFGNTLTAGLKKFEEELSDLISIEEKISNIIWDFEEDSQGREVKISELEAQHNTTFGFGDVHKKLAQLVYKHRIPSYYVYFTIKKILSGGNFRFPEGGFSLGQFASELFFIFRDDGTDHEKLIAQSFKEDELVKFLDLVDSEFAGTEEEPLPNFMAFARIYDTYGYPPDLIRVGLENYGVEISEEDFNGKFEAAQRELQKQGDVGYTTRKSQPSPVYTELLEKVGANQFHGYDAIQIADAKIVAMMDGENQVDELSEGAQGSIVLDNTPFYAEAGGQVGDVGVLVGIAYGSGWLNPTDRESDVKPPATAGGSDFKATVADTYSPVTGLIIHKVTVDKGSITVGDEVVATVDVEKRDATRRNHTATHLVHAALREVLGTHVKQAGSVVAPSVLRFDFTHYQPMTAAEIAEVEDLVNRHILANHPVNTNIMAIEEAMHGGAMALFGEKYGADVRVLSVGDGVFSKELCGGTHVRATGDIGSFKITADEAIASGVRRIRAITGFDAFERFREDERLIERSLGALKTQRDNLPNAIERLQEELKRTRKEMDELKLKIATGAIGEASSNGDEAREIKGVKILGKIVEGLDGNGTRQLSDTLLARLKSGVVILGRSDEGKVGIIVRVSDDLTSRVKAGDVIREIAQIVGGRGGGKADMAEGGGTEPDKLSEAIDASYGVIERMLT